MSKDPAPFLWYELQTTDTKAAAAFYRHVLGHEAKASTPGTPDYTILAAGPADVGGMMKLPDEACAAGARPGWMGYVAVDDVDAYAARVKAAGGSVLLPTREVPGIVRFSVVADPWGAAFTLFTGLTDERRPAVPAGTPGHVGWHELLAGDGAAAFDFYSGLFGWKKAEAVDMGPMGVYQTFGAGGPAFGGMMTKPPEAPGCFWLYYFNVEAVDAALARAKEKGARLLFGPQEVPGGSFIAQLFDPQGAMFAVVGPKR